MDAASWIGAAVGVTVLLGGGWRLVKAYHRWASAQEKQAEATSDLADKVKSLETSLNNGIRSDVSRAVQLAADAARSASVVEQGRTEVVRIVQALRSEVDVMTNVVLTDRQRLRKQLRDAGIELPDDE